MDILISKEIKSKFTKLGLYQIVGGVVGIIIILWSIFRATLLTELTLFLYLFILLFFAYSIFCGILCLKMRKNALGNSLVNQILQVLGFAMLGFAFKYASGLYLTIGLDLSESVKINFGAGISKFDFNFNNETNRVEVDFNLVAFAIVYWIDKLMKNVKEEAAIGQVSSIGNA